MTSSYWFQGLTEGPDLGDSIGQSLRFRGTSGGYLERIVATAGDSANLTLSCWFKHGQDFDTRFAMSCEPGGGGSQFTGPLVNGNGTLYQYPQPGGGDSSTNVFRDPTAWYHFVWTVDNGKWRYYINGELVFEPTTNSNTFFNAGRRIEIGSQDDGQGRKNQYLAQMYCIDGQALEPEAFGRHNRDGVWVPIKPDFSRSSAKRYSDYLTVSGGTQYGASSLAFNGDVDPTSSGSGTVYTDVDQSLIWAPEPAVPFTTSLEIYNQSAPGQSDVSWDGNTVTTANGWLTVFSGSGEVSADKPLVIQGTGARAYLNAVRIDGELVNDPFLWSKDITIGDGNTWFTGSPQSIFDGDPNVCAGTTDVRAGGTDGRFAFIYWNPEGGLTFRDKVEVWASTASNGSVFSINGGDYQTVLSGSWVTIASGGGTINNITCANNLPNNSIAYWCGIRVDGQPLIDGVNSSYGTNGFHLDFSDPNDLGADRSGNGNDFTPNGFDTAPVGLYSNDMTTNGSWNPTQPPSMAFDGSDFTEGTATASGVQTWVEFAPKTPIDITGKTVRMFNYTRPATITLGGASTTQTGTGWIEIDKGTATEISTTSPLRKTHDNPSTSTGWSVLEVDGEWLIDNTGEDYDLMQDSPTQNWATGNPLDFVPGNTPPSFNFSKANLAGVGASAGLYHGFASTAISADDTNTYYMEFSSPQASGGYPGVFVTQVNADPFWTNGLIWSAQSNDVSYNLVAQTPWTGATYTANAVAGFSYNGSTGVITGYVDGVEAGTFTADTGIDRVFGVLAPPQNITVMDFNYGQRPFIHQPAGTVPLQTQNLDKPTIVDGGEHFRTLTGTGASILSIAQGDANGDNGTGFQRGLWWIKSRINPDGQINEHQISNSALPADSWAHLPGNFNSFEAYQTPVSDSVAWCWAGDDVTGADLAAVNANGDLPLSGLVRNIDAGMSSGYYNGSPDGTEQAAGTELSFPHGLSQAPEFVAVTLMDDNGAGSTNMWQVYSSSPNDRAVRSLILRSSDSGFDPDFFWTTEQEATTDTLVRVRVGPSDLVSNTLNRRRTCGYDSNYFFMAFHSVPGYSSFGNYTGNDNDGDGPFVYTGFRPSFLLIKSVDLNTENWVMLDGSRSTDNPVADYLMANKSQEEKDGTSFAPAIAVDFLANGFKIRGSNNINLGTGRYFYAAFARHPFGGKGIAPSTAAFVGPDYYDGILPGIANSLRFRGAQQLIGPGYKGTTTTGTFSCWIKFATSDPTAMYICGQQIIAGTAGCDLLRESNSFSPANVINQGQAPVNQFQSPGSIRDQSAWYNLVWNFNGGTNTAELYINGVLVDTLVNTNNRQVSGNDNWPIIWGNNGAGTSTLTLQAYLADCYYVDGQALDATQFGQYDTNGVWVPNEYTGTYGANGFHLVMDPAYQSGDILRDQSGNGNDFTMTGFETGDFYSADFDYMKDGPTENYATFNPLFTNGNTGPGTLSDGNLGYTAYVSPGYKVVPGTQSLKGGAYYWEYTAGNVNNSYPGEVGIIRGTSPATSTRIGWDTNNNVFGFALRFNGELIGDSSGEGTSTDQTLTNLPTGFSQGDIIGMYCDIPNNYLAWYKNGVLHYEITNVNSEYDWIPAAGQYYNFAHNSVNFGQQPFRYPLPAGYQALQTANLPEPTIANGRDHFGVSLYTGTNPSVSVTDLNFQPDFVWIKCRTASTNHALFDSVRGVELALSSESTAGESPNDGTRLNSFDSNGFTVGTNSNVNDFGKPMVAWCWKAGGAAVTNNDGSIETQVSANVDAGFSIISYIGNGVDGSTLGHGLNRAPEFIILKNRDANVSDNFWSVYHASAFQSSAAPQILYLNRSDGGSNDTNVLGTTVDINATTFTIGTYNGTNLNSDNHIAYCWHSVPGYSAFGRYTGNDNADGPFVYTGFRPAFVLVKRSNGDSNWCMLDSTRDVANPTDRTLFANSDGQEVNSGDSNCDFLSNGFKVRHSNGAFNNDGDTYIYCAFAENPINISNAK